MCKRNLLFGLLTVFTLAGPAWAQYYPQPSYYGYQQNPYYYTPNNNYQYYGAAAYPNYYFPTSQQSPSYNSSAPVYSAPAAPVYSAPAAPVYSAPAAPVYSEPAAPVYSAPAAYQPVQTAPPRLAAADPGPAWAENFAALKSALAPKGCVWVDADYLLWWVKNGGPGFPLVTTDSKPGAGNPLAGSLGNPTTQVLNNGVFKYPGLNGLRVTVGGWCDEHKKTGWEVSGFVLEQRSVGFHSSSDGTGNPPLYLPAFNSFLNREDRLLVSDPTQHVSGNVAITSQIQLWGVEGNALWNLCQVGKARLDLLVGIRNLNLDEAFELQNSTTVPKLGVLSLQDRFHTTSNFYGGQVGARYSCCSDCYTFSLTSKIAVGANQDLVAISGNNQVGGASTAGGFFAQPTNIGRTSHGGLPISVASQVGVKVGIRCTSWMNIALGYDLLAWTNVVRAADQIDRNLNLTQSPAAGGSGTLVGPARPMPLFERSDFWAQGVTLGFEFRY